MLEHHIQKSIVYRLAFTPELRFSELKPDGLENKLFDYHLKIVIRDGYVEKSEDGRYKLTGEGRRLGVRAFEKQLGMADKAESVLFLVIKQNPNGPWLLYKRLTHPMLGKVGFMHAMPKLGQSITKSAHDQCLEKTGLSCKFTALGSGYFTTYDGELLESYVNFTLMAADTAEGELVQQDVNAEYFWSENPDFGSADMIPNMTTLAELLQGGQPFFVEKTFNY